MRHRASSKFWEHYRRLPPPVQTLADENFKILKVNPRHLSLHFKKIEEYHIVRVGLKYRAVAVEDGEDLVWFWIGPHPEYERLLRTLRGG
ncbi:MAG: hypothetical protein FJZ95_08580 [Chloroflexi bacterium]|nr:hypothetical protein [Chloroflexota bacterium]